MAKKPKAAAAPPPFDPSRFGQIVTAPPAVFPYEPGTDGIPFPALPDPLGCGQAAIDFLHHFEIPEGRAAGKCVGENLPPFIERAIRGIMGHRDPETWTRYIRAAMFTAPRKSMKSWLSALLGILFLFSEQERNGEILIVATAQRQARRIYDLIMMTLRSNPNLLSTLRVQDVGSTLTNLRTGTRLIATPADPAKLWGLSPSVILSDEAHAWRGQKGQKLWSSVITGQGARPSPLWVITSTCPDDPPAFDDVYAEQLRYALQVQSGEKDDRRYLPMLWVCPDSADITSEETWRRYNPGVGHSLDLDEIREEFERAKDSDSGLAGFKAMRLNQIPTSSLDAGWLKPDAIARCVQPVASLEEMADMPRKAIGLDMGGSFDLASMSIIAMDDAGIMHVRQHSWLCRTGFDHFKTKAPLQQFVERGELTIEGEDAVSTELIASEIVDIANAIGVTELAVDPSMLTVIGPQLEANGIELREARQGSISMTPAMHFTEERISAGEMVIGDDALMKWTLGNVGVVSNSTGRRPCKLGNDSSANHKKIDPVSALLTAVQLINEQRFGEGSAYVKRDVVEMICPFTDPINAIAVMEGGVAVSLLFGTPNVDEGTGAWLI